MATRKMQHRTPISEQMDETRMRNLLLKKSTQIGAKQLQLCYLLAIELGEMDTMMVCVEKGVSPRCDKDFAMVIACRNQRVDIALWLVEQGADVSCRDHRPLREACEMDCRDTLAFLIKQGIDVTVKSDFAISRAARYGNFEIALMLVENGASLTNLSNYMKKNLYTNPKRKMASLTADSCPEMVAHLVESYCQKHRTNAGAEFIDAPQWLKPYYMQYLFQ